MKPESPAASRPGMKRAIMGLKDATLLLAKLVCELGKAEFFKGFLFWNVPAVAVILFHLEVSLTKLAAQLIRAYLPASSFQPCAILLTGWGVRTLDSVLIVPALFDAVESSKFRQLVSAACRKHANITLLLFSCFRSLAHRSIRYLPDQFKGVSRLSITALSLFRLVAPRRDYYTVLSWYVAACIVDAIMSIREGLPLLSGSDEFPYLLWGVITLVIPLNFFADKSSLHRLLDKLGAYLAERNNNHNQSGYQV